MEIRGTGSPAYVDRSSTALRGCVKGASILPHMRPNDTWQDAVRYHEQYAFDGNDQDEDYAQDYCDENESVLDDMTATSSVGWNGAAQFDRCRQCCFPGSVKLALQYSLCSGSVRFWASRIQIH
jgi:hypothetical protein